MKLSLTSRRIRTLAIALSVSLTGASAAFGGDAPDPYAPLIQQVEAAQKHNKASEQADALYDLAKAHFDNRDLANAESLMQQSLLLEKTLKRPASLIRTETSLATILVAANKTDDASKAYQEALESADLYKMINEAISIRISLGSLALQKNQPDEAGKLYHQALADAQAHGLPSLASSALINLAVLARAQNNLADAESFLNQALPLIEKDGSDSALGNALMELGRTQADSGKFDEAQASYQKAKDHYAQDMDNVSAGKAQMAVGQLLLTRGKLAEANAQLQEAEKTVMQEGPNLTAVDCLVSLGACLTTQQQFDESDKTLQQALSLAQSLKSPDRKRAVLSEQGYLFIVRGLPEKALAKYLSAYQLLPKGDSKPSKIRAVLLSDLAMCYKALGQIEPAISNYEQAYSILAAMQDVNARALAANNLAVAYLDGGKMQDFERIWHQASTLFEQTGDKKGLALLSYNLGQSKLYRGDAKDSITDYQTALSIMRTTNDTSGVSQSLRGLGLAYLLNAQPTQAVDCYKEALTLAEKSNDSEAQWDSYLGLGKAYKALGQTDQALASLRQAVDIAEQERNSLSRDTFKTFNLDLRQDCFYELSNLLIEQNQSEEALAIAERSRARAFADLLAARQETVSHHFGGNADSASSSSTVDCSTLPANLAELTQESSTASPVATQALSTSELKQVIKDHGSACLEYYVLPDKLVSWVVDADGTVHLIAPQKISARNLANKVTDLYNSVIAQPRSLEEIKQSGTLRQTRLKEMYKLLVGPAEPYLASAKQVVIVPHGPLFLVPFASLMNNQGKFLVELHTLSLCPAISVLQATAKLEQNALPDTRLLTFGNPTTEAFAQLGALPYAEKEAQKVAELFGDKNATIELTTQANRARFVQFAPNSSVLHMACHGIINEEHPTLSGLVLAKDGSDNGFLSVRDILALPPLKARLIVLSACQTGRGKITGDGVIGLSRAFIAAGTPSVIVSQWNVDDVIAEYQMEEFYKSYLGGKGTAESLRQAQLKTISSMEGSGADTSSPTFIRANPRYWAAFQLIGEAH